MRTCKLVRLLQLRNRFKCDACKRDFAHKTRLSNLCCDEEVAPYECILYDTRFTRRRDLDSHLTNSGHQQSPRYNLLVLMCNYNISLSDIFMFIEFDWFGCFNKHFSRRFWKILPVHQYMLSRAHEKPQRIGGRTSS